MHVVGVDFGTTNVRISTWDSDGDVPPQPVRIGAGADGTTAMPAVVALRRLPGGEVSIIVGEEADAEEDVDNETLVLRNIKRYALSEDKYLRRHLCVANASERQPKWPPCWWNAEEQSVHALDRVFPVWDLVEALLAEAFRRARIGGEFEWRAGCPVHAGLGYREQLTRTLEGITGKGDIHWIAMEPILYMILADRLGVVNGGRPDGAFLMYDFGGGSFDCALVEIVEGQMTVYGADGHPLLGGSDIDEALRQMLAYGGQPALLRRAKERLGPDNPSESLADGTTISLEDLQATMADGRFVDQSLNPMRDAYMGAKVVWKRGEGQYDPPMGDVISQDPANGTQRFVWQLRWNDIAADIEGIILAGGPTKSPYFTERLADLCGDQINVLDPSELFPTLTGIPDLETVGISMGACYSFAETYSPLYVNRLPVKVTLENLESGDGVEYEPFESLTRTFKPFGDFVSEKGLDVRPISMATRPSGQRIRLTIAHPDGEEVGHCFVDKHVERHVSLRIDGYSLRLVIDRLGRVGVELHLAGMNLQDTKPRRYMVVPEPPWQTELQREALSRLDDQLRRYEEREGERTSLYINSPPWEYPTS